MTNETLTTLPQTKAELLERIREARSALEQAVDQLSEAQLTTPDPDTGWTIKDHLTHLAAWEDGIAALLQHRPRWAAMGVDEATVAKNDMDALNEALYQRSRGLPLSQSLVAFRDSYQRLLATLAGFADEDLFKTYSYYQPNEPGEDNSKPILWWIVANTYEHYAEHQASIEAAKQR